MSTSTDHFAALNAPMERRFYPRVIPSAPIYVAFGSNNLGTLQNISENGFSVVTPSHLDLNSVYRVFLSLDGVPSAITVSVRTVWTAESQSSSGIQLLDLSEQDREQIRKWVALQSSRNETVDHWLLPKNASASPEATEPPHPEPTQKQQSPPPPVVESPAKPKFPPMPLPIHGEFTYEPPPGLKKEILPLRRRKRTSRPKSRSSISGLLLGVAFMTAVCLTAGWSLRHGLVDKFLHRSTLVARDSAPSIDEKPSSVVHDEPILPPPTETPSNPAFSTGADSDADATPIAPPPATEAKPVSPTVAITKRLEPKAPARESGLDAPSKRSYQLDAPQTSRTYVGEAVPIPAPVVRNNETAARRSAQETISAPVITTPPPATATPLTSNTLPTPAKNPPPVNASGANDSMAKIPSSSTPGHKSAIAGSIYESGGSTDLYAGKPSSAAGVSSPSPVLPPPSRSSTASSGSNSYVARSSNGVNSSASSAIQMDAPPTVVEVTAPRSFTAAYVNLPGERVLRSASFTIHVQRSVRVPGERVPGERWVWRGHKKVSVGELTSRVDPQIPQTPAPYGSITVQATIDKGGYVTNLHPLYGSFAFLPNVSRAIREWRYEPTYVDNKAVETQAKIEIEFHPPSARGSKP
jgi:hypothetical protein